MIHVGLQYSQLSIILITKKKKKNWKEELVLGIALSYLIKNLFFSLSLNIIISLN